MSKRGTSQAGSTTGWVLTWCVIGALLLCWAAVAVRFTYRLSQPFQGLIEALEGVR
jgi:hypothetical protein